MSRLALSDTDKKARDWFVHIAESLGCRVSIDVMGNTFAVRPGRRMGFPPTCAGSHLDTQPTGGRYDGILGVCSGVELLRVLHEEKIETEFPVGVVNWTKYAYWFSLQESKSLYCITLRPFRSVRKVLDFPSAWFRRAYGPERFPWRKRTI